MALAAGEEGFGIGVSLPRKEDARHLHGRGEFVSDIRMPDMSEVVFVRSPHANARIRKITIAPRGEGPCLHCRRPAAASSRSASSTSRRARARRPGRRSRPTRRAMSARRSLRVSRRPAPRRKALAALAGGSTMRRSTRSSMRRAQMRGGGRWCTRPGATTSSSSGTIEAGVVEAAKRDAGIVVTREFRMNRAVGLADGRPRGCWPIAIGASTRW